VLSRKLDNRLVNLSIEFHILFWNVYEFSAPLTLTLIEALEGSVGYPFYCLLIDIYIFQQQMLLL
jgi:hypothetical protein